MRVLLVALAVFLQCCGLYGSRACQLDVAVDGGAAGSVVTAVAEESVPRSTPRLSGSASALFSESKWISLIDGMGLKAWRQNAGAWVNVGNASQSAEDARLLTTEPGHGVLVNGPTGKTTDLLSRLEHADVELHVESMVPKGSNSGIYFQSRYEIQIFDSWGKKNLGSGDCGSIYERWKEGRGFEGHPAKVNASRPPGEWQTFDVRFRAPRFDGKGKKIAHAKFIKVIHNGQTIHENVEVTGPTRSSTFDDEKPTGPLMLQGDHGPVAYRNLRLRLIQVRE